MMMTAATKPAGTQEIDLTMDDVDGSDKQLIPSSPKTNPEPPDPVVRINPGSDDLMRHSQMEGIPRAPTNLDSSTATADEAHPTVNQEVQSQRGTRRLTKIELTT
jgi:hypothetical protein